MEIIFWVSDALSPLWCFIIMRYAMKHGLNVWQSWGIASVVCLTQAYVVAKLVGWNLGGYLIALIAAIPSLLVGANVQTRSELWIWILPPFQQGANRRRWAERGPGHPLPSNGVLEAGAHR
jgi:hypothetical protein